MKSEGEKEKEEGREGGKRGRKTGRETDREGCARERGRDTRPKCKHVCQKARQQGGYGDTNAPEYVIYISTYTDEHIHIHTHTRIIKVDTAIRELIERCIRPSAPAHTPEAQQSIQTHTHTPANTHILHL